ncbi:MAG: hypothetical protein ABSE92_13060 [Terriglobales bacterium]
MAKLNGWQRIGIIASVVWILGTGARTYDSEIERASSLIYLSCDSAAKAPLPSKPPNSPPEPGAVPVPPGAVVADDCEQAKESLGLAIKNAKLDAALVALVPVPLGWGIIYLVLFLVRWVKRGFARPLQ